MIGYCVMRNGSLGFGMSEKEASDDAYINKCRGNLGNDVEHKFAKQKQKLSVWSPASDLLHISDIGCLQIVDGMLKDLRSGKVIRLNSRGNIFYYCLHLFGSLLSYTEILCVISKALEDFLDSYSKDYVHVANLPMIQVVELTNEFSPNVTYMLDNEFIIGTYENCLGIKGMGDEAYYVLNGISDEETRFILPYLGYRVGCVFEEDY